MNCDDFLPAIETGGLLARLRARRHAAECARCSKVYAEFTTLKRQWSNAAPPPLAPRQRQMWKNAATVESGSAPSRLGWITFAGGLAAVGVCVVIFIVVRPARELVKVEPPPLPSRTIVSDVTVTDLVPAREFDALSDAVDQLDADLVKLRRDAQRLEARQELAMTLERFGTW